jgi:hypothetical protein
MHQFNIVEKESYFFREKMCILSQYIFTVTALLCKVIGFKFTSVCFNGKVTKLEGVRPQAYLLPCLVLSS